MVWFGVAPCFHVHVHHTCCNHCSFFMSTSITAGALTQSYSSPILTVMSDEEVEETYVLPSSMPGSYAIQITGSPTTIQTIASQSPYASAWPVFGTTSSEGVDMMTPTPTHTPLLPPLDQLEKAAVVAIIADMDLDEVSMYLSLHSVLSIAPLSPYAVLSIAPLSPYAVLSTCSGKTLRQSSSWLSLCRPACTAHGTKESVQCFQGRGGVCGRALHFTVTSTQSHSPYCPQCQNDNRIVTNTPATHTPPSPQLPLFLTLTPVLCGAVLTCTGKWMTCSSLIQRESFSFLAIPKQ